MYGEWKAKLRVYFRATVHKHAYQWIAWAGEQHQPLVEDDLDLAFGGAAGEIKDFSRALHAQLVSTTTEHPFQLVHNCPGGNGLEAMRAVIRRYEPRTPGTKRAVLKAIITNPPSRRAEEVERSLFKAEELMNEYEVLAGKPLDEDLGVTVIIDLCVQDLKDRLEPATHVMQSLEVREEIMSFSERRQDTFGGPRPMDLDSRETDHPDPQYNWWGGAETYWQDESVGWWPEEEECGEERSTEISQMNFQRGKGKGHGGTGKDRDMESPSGTTRVARRDGQKETERQEPPFRESAIGEASGDTESRCH